jgi:hypothetical protein
MTILLLFLAALQAAPPPAQKPIPPAEAQPFLRNLLVKKGKVAGERVTAYEAQGCAATLSTASRTWRIDWTKAKPSQAITAYADHRIGLPIEGDEGVVRDAAGAPVAALPLTLPINEESIVGIYVADGLALACRKP